MSFYITYIMLINVTSINQTIYIFISVGEASVIVGDRGGKSSGSPWTWSSRKFSVSETLFHAFYNIMKDTDLVYFMP